MTAAVAVDPRVMALARAVGLVDADGHVVAAWFEQPLSHLRRMVSDPVQRRALLDLLESALPAAPAAGAGPGEQWHPLVEGAGYGIYLVVTGDVIGVAARAVTSALGSGAAHAGAGEPGVGLMVRLPLVDTAGELTAVAGTAEGPLEVTVELAAEVDLALRVLVDLSGGARVRVLVSDLDLGDGRPRTVELDPAAPGADAAMVLVGLLRKAMDELGVDADPLTTHLPGLLGLAPGLPPFPVGDLARDPTAFRAWVGQLTADPATLGGWFGHLAGLLGAATSGTTPPFTGAGSPQDPLCATVLDAPGGPRVAVTAARGDSGLLLGLAVAAGTDEAEMRAEAVLAAVPTTAAAPVQLLPWVDLVLAARPELPPGGPASVGSVVAGVRWRDGAVRPRLELRDVRLGAAAPHPLLDLSSGEALEAAGGQLLEDALVDALGDTRAGRAVLALVGLAPPTADLTSPHRVSLEALAVGPTRAVAAFHHRVLRDPDHRWSALLGEIASLLGVDPTVTGGGSRTDPWRAPLATAGAVGVSLAAWTEEPVTAATTLRSLRLGLALDARLARADVAVRAPVLGFDLGEGTTRTALLPEVVVTVETVPPAVTTAGGAVVDATAAAVECRWAPATGVLVHTEVAGLRLRLDNEQVVLDRLSLPPPGGFDTTAPDLGLGVPVPALTGLLRILCSEAALALGGPTGVAVTALLGLHRRLPALPPDWPVLLDTAADLPAVVRDPVSAVQRQLRRVATDPSVDGTPFALPAVRWLTAVLDGRTVAGPRSGWQAVRDAAARLDPFPRGWGSEANPWRLPVPLDRRVRMAVWTREGDPDLAWVTRTAEHVRAASTATELVSALTLLHDAVPAAAGAVTGRDPNRLDDALEALDRWLSTSDGLLTVVEQSAVGQTWQTDTVAAGHADVPTAAAAVSRVSARLDDWAPADGRCVLLVSAPFEDHRVWSDLLAALEPDHPPEAHFHLRVPGVDPLALDLGEVRTRAQVYTVDLQGGQTDPRAPVAQLAAVVDRARQLTGVDTVHLVAHSSSGVTAAAYAAAHPERVAGLVTLATAHVDAALSPFGDMQLCDAVRAASAIAGGASPLPALRAVAFLADAMDTAPTTAAPTIAAAGVAFPAAALTTAAPDAGVPGLALAAAAGGGLLGQLADALADQVLASAPVEMSTGDLPDGGPGPASNGLAIGLIVDPDLPAPGTGPEVSAEVRLPLTEVPLVPTGGGASPARRRRAAASATVTVPDGWLHGGPRPDGAPGEARARWARLGVSLTTAPGGGPLLEVVGDLHDAAVTDARRSVTRPLVDLPSALGSLAEDLPAVPLPAAPDGTAAALVRDTLSAAGLLTATEDALVTAALRSLVTAPSALLRPLALRLAELLLPALGVAGAPGGPWSALIPTMSARLEVRAQPWTATLAAAPGTASGAVILSGALDVSARTTTPTLAVDAGARLHWDQGGAQLVAEVPGWVQPVTLLPRPTQPTVPPDLPAALAYATVTGLLTVVVDPMLPDGIRLAPLAGLLRDPVRHLSSGGTFRGPGGAVDPAAVDAALATLSRLLGTPSPGGGLHLPGGLAVRALPDPARLLLTGTLDLGGADTAEVAVGVRLDAPSGIPTGEVRLTVAVGGWDTVTVALGADPSGLTLTVTPVGWSEPITLLPHLHGLAALAGGATRLLPTALQGIVDSLSTPGPRGPALQAALDVAAALGVYGDDREGFTRPDRAAELARMLQPDWLTTRSGAATAVAQALEALLAALGLPLSTVQRQGALLRAAVAVDSAEVALTAGWAPGGASGPEGPVLALELTGLDLGPVRVEQARAGYDGTVDVTIDVALRPEAPVAFLQPALRLATEVDPRTGQARFTIQLLPLGEAQRDDAAVTLAPSPQAVLTEHGATLLVRQWVVPLVTALGLSVFADRAGTALWTGGPSPVDVLTAAGLVVAGSDPPELVAAPPPLDRMALRGLAALAAGLSAGLGSVRLALVTDGDRYGVRLGGRQLVHAGDLDVSVRFGDTDWLADDHTAGVSLWLLQDQPGTDVPALRPALDLTGLGAVLTGRDGPLVDGALHVDGVGLFGFARARFTTATGDPAVTVTDLGLGGQLDGARLVLAAEDGDSFVAKLLPGGVQADLDVATSWRPGQGLRTYRAAAAGGLEVTVPLDIDATVLRITELWLRLTTTGRDTSLAAALSGRGDLGPLHLVVTRVGVRVDVGPGGARFGFRAPDGAGLSLDAGVVAGGGYLAHDESRHQYAGAIALRVAAISLQAVGIVTTRRADGSPGFSLLIIISAEFTPIQLGFGFTLVGVGGLLGLNRTTDIPVLRAGVRDGTLGSILFPTDLVANAPKIVSDLIRVFPEAPGRFLIGPMAKIGWGTPPLVTVTLGVIIDLPSPVRLLVLGRVRMVLPDESDAVVQLNLDLLGVLDLNRGELSFDASLYDSRIAAFDVSGDMALRASWGAAPVFALSAGGFHPTFSPPAGFPVLRRLAISLATGDNPRIRLESYLALTSNTAQFGARLDLYAEACGFSVEGWLAFDALFQFDPFAFLVDISGGVRVKRGRTTLLSVMVELHLSGPRPWRARGLATFHVLFLDVSVSFDVTIGRADPPPLPEPVDVAALLEAALDDPRSWAAQLPPAGDTLFTLRAVTPGPDELVMHPLGSLSFRQRVVPLATVIERFGTARPKDDTRFDVTVAVAGMPAVTERPLEEQFAPGQFFAISDTERLTRPSFLPMPAGQQVAAARAGRDTWLVRAAPLDYEVKVVDAPDTAPAPRAAARLAAPDTGSPHRPPRRVRSRPPRTLDAAGLEATLATAPAATAPTRTSGAARFAGPHLQLGVRPRPLGEVP